MSHTRYTTGTLSYTKPALFVLFAWLLWGDFCFMMMETVVPAVVPLKLNALQAPNWVIGLILTTAPGFLNMTLCPWVSFKSDRFRSRWGRRIPFILFTLPFLCASLVLLGLSENIATWLHAAVGPLTGVSPATLTIGLIAIFMFAFKFFDMFVGSVFHCLFNDTVPVEFMGRFMGLFRIVSTAAGALFNVFIFKYSDTHMREIFIGAALLYLIGVGWMCLRVKEGEYPPVQGEVERSGLLGDVKTYGKESFSHRLYLQSYLTQAFSVMAAGSGVFLVFFYREMGLSLEQIGWLAGLGGVAGMVATLLAASFVDRWHPLRIMTYLALFTAVTGFVNWVWIPVTLPGQLFFWLGIGTTVTAAFSGALGGISSYTMLMRIYPQSRYAQFCSARAVVVSLANILAGFAVGLFLDGIKSFWPGGGFCYRWLFLWSWPFTIAAAAIMIALYREWRKLGGDMHYRPPAPWNADGKDEMGREEGFNILLRPRLTMLSLHLFTAGFALTLLLTPVFCLIMQRHGLIEASRWYLIGFVPGMSLLFVLWLWLVRAVRRDVDECVAGRVPRLGIPHYGILMVLGIQSLIAFPIYWMQILWTSELDMQRELLFFAGANILSSAAILIFVQVLRWVERPVTAEKNHCPVPAIISINPTIQKN
jgi:maltose/moltooligosaccharide transporter